MPAYSAKSLAIMTAMLSMGAAATGRPYPVEPMTEDELKAANKRQWLKYEEQKRLSDEQDNLRFWRRVFDGVAHCAQLQEQHNLTGAWPRQARRMLLRIEDMAERNRMFLSMVKAYT